MKLKEAFKDIKRETHEVLIIFILGMLLLIGITSWKNRDEIEYLEARVNDLELMIRWGSNAASHKRR